MLKNTVGETVGRLTVVGQWEVLGQTVRLLDAELQTPAWEVWVPQGPFFGTWESWHPVSLQTHVRIGVFSVDHPFWAIYRKWVAIPGEAPECASEPLYALARRLGYSDIGDCRRVVETVRAVLRGDLGDANHD